MYAQLGNIKFQGLIGWDSFSRRTEAIYADHELIEGKPRSQKLGNALDAIRFDIQLHHSFSNVPQDIEALRNACINGDVLPLISGNGTFYGTFVIRTIDEIHQQTFADGTLLLANLSVELKEYVEQSATPASGFAAFATKVIATTQFQGGSSMLLKSAVETTAAATTAGTHVENASKDIPGAISKAQRVLKKVRDGLTTTQRLLDQAKFVITAKDRITNDINRTQQAVQNTTDALADGDIDGAIEANKQMQNGISAMNGGLSEVAVITAIRKPI